MSDVDSGALWETNAAAWTALVRAGYGSRREMRGYTSKCSATEAEDG